ncbi:E3 ubiquitin-protein ligase MARCH2, partial [Clonorchis sinensis]
MHRGCLEKWLNASKTNACEICNYEFKVEYAYPSFSEWLKHGGEGEYRARRRHLWTDCVCFVIMIPLMILCAWLTAASARSEGSPVRFSWQSISLGSLFAVLFVVFVIWIV